MAANEFHLFSLLPGELRDQIWDQSVRPYGIRGVQYFSVFSYFAEDTAPESFRRHLIPPTKNNQLVLIGPPKPENTESLPSWNLNQSTYSIDGGLWTACKESRAAMARRYKPERWSQFYDRQRNRRKSWASKPSTCDETYWITDNGKYDDMPATFLVNSDKGHQYFTLMPAQDLIYIQGLPCAIWGVKGFRESMPFSSPWYGFGGFCHLAIEFDPLCTLEELDRYERSWYHGSDHGIPDVRWSFYSELIRIMREDSGYVTVWLVDPRLRLRNTEIPAVSQNSVKEASGRIIFEANGCKYHEVEEWDSSCDYDAETADQPGFLSVWDFVYEVREVAYRMHAYEEEVDYEVPVMNEVEFLVCEKDE
ncbi:hypothetical protein LZ32DRAFT_43909 [Colletotrichum eremochloae]|nr:hypothetical protein LZ32DRAFT_43909 [Colletotrichum eremochloae]